jgi:hypothetical protein
LPQRSVFVGAFAPAASGRPDGFDAPGLELTQARRIESIAPSLRVGAARSDPLRQQGANPAPFFGERENYGKARRAREVPRLPIRLCGQDFDEASFFESEGRQPCLAGGGRKNGGV